jgi:hypothetical protein
VRGGALLCRLKSADLGQRGPGRRVADVVAEHVGCPAQAVHPGMGSFPGSARRRAHGPASGGWERPARARARAPWADGHGRLAGLGLWNQVSAAR